MHPTSPMSGSFTGLLSTPPGDLTFPPISPTGFISPPGYTPYVPTGPSGYYPMPFMQSSGPSMPQSLPIHMEPGGSSMPVPMPSEDAPGDTSAPGVLVLMEIPVY